VRPGLAGISDRLADDDLTRAVNSVRLNDVFRQIQADSGKLHGERLLYTGLPGGAQHGV
jgi:hypothetical protein